MENERKKSQIYLAYLFEQLYEFRQLAYEYLGNACRCHL